MLAWVVPFVFGQIRGAWRNSRLREHGTRAIATIQGVKQMGGSDDHAWLEFRARVAPDAGVALDVRFEAGVQLLDLHRMQRGQKLNVCFDPKDRERVTLASKYLVEPEVEDLASKPDPDADS